MSKCKSPMASVGAAALAFEPVRAADAPKPNARRGSPKRYEMLKSINLWAFPYPDRMNLRECLQLAKDAQFDGIDSDHVRVHFDTGNISMFQHAEHWVPILGKRTRNIHFKEFTKKGTDYSLETFRPLLDGTTNWPAVTEALDKVGYRGFLTFEYFHPYTHYAEALIYQTSDSLHRILGRKS